MRNPRNLLLLAILIGALSAAMVYRYMRGLRSEVETARRTTAGTVDVVVANEAIPLGTRIEPKLLKTVPWPENLVPDGAITDPKTVVDSVAQVAIAKNQPLSQSQVSTQGGLLSSRITGGMRAMSVKVDDVTGVSGFIAPNSRVDVLIAGATGDESSQEQRSKLVLQNIRVLAIGKSIDQREDKAVEVPTVTLLVSPEEAEKLTLAARYEPVRLALRNHDDDLVVGTPGISSATLFGGGARQIAPPPAPLPAPPVATPAPAPAAPAREVRRERRPRYSVEVLLGEKPTRQDLF